jgi:hypothetical protein
MSHKRVTAPLLLSALALFSGASVSSSPHSAAAAQPTAVAIDMNGLSKADQKKYAASHFLGFYTLNGRTSADVCRAEGVDLAVYLRAFQLKHMSELAQAEKVMMASGVSTEEMAAVAREKRKDMEATIRHTMLELANALHGTTVADGCAYVAGHAAEAASAQSFAEQNPEVEAVLMSD